MPLIVCWTSTSHQFKWGASPGPPKPPRVARGAPAGPGRPPVLSAPALLEDLFEGELAADRGVGLRDLEAGHGVVVDVAVLVEAPLAVDALEVLGRGDGLAQRLALLLRVLGLLDGRGRALDGVEDH